VLTALHQAHPCTGWRPLLFTLRSHWGI